MVLLIDTLFNLNNYSSSLIFKILLVLFILMILFLLMLMTHAQRLDFKILLRRNWITSIKVVGKQTKHAKMWAKMHFMNGGNFGVLIQQNQLLIC
jgi:hypothetical protein